MSYKITFTAQAPASTGVWNYSFPSIGLLLALAEMHKTPVSLFLQLAKVPLDGSASPFL